MSKDVKCQEVKQLDLEGGSEKKDNEINFDVTYESHQYWSETYFINILRIFDDHHV